MQRTDFHYDLPPELIAQHPLPERSASRLLCLDGNSGAIAHRQFTDLTGLVNPGDLLVFNNTREPGIDLILIPAAKTDQLSSLSLSLSLSPYLLVYK